MQNTILDQNRLLQINTSGFSQLSLASSADLPSTQALPPETGKYLVQFKSDSLSFCYVCMTDSHPCLLADHDVVMANNRIMVMRHVVKVQNGV